MFRLSAHQNGDTFDIWLFDDHAEDHGGDHNLPEFWEDLLEGATSVTVEWAIAADPGPPAKPQGAWQTFTVDLLKPQGYVKRVLRRNLNGVPRERKYVVRFSIDGGPWLGPVSFYWGA